MLKQKIIKIVRENVGMPEHFKDKKYLESIDHQYANPITDQILSEVKRTMEECLLKEDNYKGDLPNDRRGYMAIGRNACIREIKQNFKKLL